MSDPVLPVTLRLGGRRVLVVGGGQLAARRVRRLLEADAAIVLVAPDVVPLIGDLAAAGRIQWHRRPYRTADLDGAWLVQTATGTSVDDEVAADAEKARVWCFKGGDPLGASAWTPAVAKVDDVTIAVSGGGDARRAAHLRDAVAAVLESGDLPLRHRTHHPGGRVVLVGGGPGDADLLTARGRRAIAEADVLVVDRLAPRLEHLDPDTTVIDVGKRPGHHPVPQERINELLIEHARAGQVVVRLKGGDPYVLGRGGEERQACEQAGISVEVVPGVTSAIAVPAAAGIPVTHRGVATGFSVVTGHDHHVVGLLPPRGDHTLVLLMAVQRLGATTGELIAAGHDPHTPAAVIERGFAPDQRVTTGTLSTIAEQAAQIGAQAPAVIVIGDVVRLSPNWQSR